MTNKFKTGYTIGVIVLAILAAMLLGAVILLAIGADVMGVDDRITLDEASRRLGGNVPLQGNVDPAVLGAGDAVLQAHVRDVVRRGNSAPAHILNLGHGVPPSADPAVLTGLVEFAHALPDGGRVE